MDDCRICLQNEGDKDIFEQNKIEENDSKSLSEILLFCLNIVAQECKLGTKICIKCYEKVISFGEFKTLAQQNDAYLRNLNFNVDIKNEVFLLNDSNCQGTDNDNSENEKIDCDDVKTEINQDDDVDDKHDFLQSDDMLLSVIKTIKYENASEESKENDPVKKRVFTKKERSRGKRNLKRGQICDECGKTVINLKEHMIRHQSINVRKRIKCKICDKLFTSYSARYRHNKISHLGIKQHCDICNKDVTSLRAHQLIVHKADELPFECVPCGRRFISQSTLDMHTTIHTKDRPYACNQCDKKFRNNFTMIQHKRQVHDKEKSHLCQFCSKSFFKKYHLQVHLRSHTKEKPFQCVECKKWFSSSTTLKNHQLIHSKEKTFACTRCDMTFYKPGYLRAHMISHTKEKRYSCKYCGVRFGRSDHRKRHEYTAHERILGLLPTKQG